MYPAPIVDEEAFYAAFRDRRHGGAAMGGVAGNLDHYARGAPLLNVVVKT
jgi:hypothetical protein